MNRVKLFALNLTTGSAVTEIVLLGLGEKTSRFQMFIWPVIVTAWSLIVLATDYTHRTNRKTIEMQQATIRSQGELIGRILTRKE